MKRAVRYACIAGILFISAQHLPAPISEPTPTGTIPESKVATAKEKSIESKPSSSRRFDGIWIATLTQKQTVSNIFGAKIDYPFDYRDTLTIKDGKSANLTAERTGTLPRGGWWGFLPKEYRQVSPLIFKTKYYSDHLVVTGSDVMIRWSGGQLIDWTPKNLPREEAQKASGVNSRLSDFVGTLKGDELVVANLIYHRAK